MEKQTFIDSRMGLCITDLNGRTSPCTFAEASLIKSGWNFTDIGGVLTRTLLGQEVVIDLSMPKILGHYQVLKLDIQRRYT